MIEVIATMPSLLDIHYPDGTTLTLQPVPRTRLKELRGKFVALQADWIGYAFGTGDTVADDAAWTLMQAIAAMLPRQDNPAVTGFDLERISNDYAQLEQLFFADTREVSAQALHGYTVATFDLDKFVGCRILTAHGINPKAILEEADEHRRATASRPPATPPGTKNRPPHSRSDQAA